MERSVSIRSSPDARAEEPDGGGPVCADRPAVRDAWRARARGAARHVGAVFEEATRRFAAARADLLGAGLAFHVLTSLAPLLLVSLAVLSLFVEVDNAAAPWRNTLAHLVGRNVADLAIGWVREARHLSASATVLGTVLFLLGASRLYVHFRAALCAIFQVSVDDAAVSWGTWLRSLLRVRLIGAATGLAAAMALGITVLVGLLLDSFASKVLPAGLSTALAELVRLVLSLGVLTLAFAALYRAIPERVVSGRHALTGALVTASSMMLANELLTFYFELQSHFEVYGPATAVIAVLVWLVWTSQVVLFGAAITAAMHRLAQLREV